MSDRQMTHYEGDGCNPPHPHVHGGDCFMGGCPVADERADDAFEAAVLADEDREEPTT